MYATFASSLLLLFSASVHGKRGEGDAVYRRGGGLRAQFLSSFKMRRREEAQEVDHWASYFFRSFPSLFSFGKRRGEEGGGGKN